jgi:hypothetical protein
MTAVQRVIVAWVFSLGWAVCLPANAAINDFVGPWNNADSATRGISRLEFRREGDQLFVHAWGKCHPRDCDWGEVAVQPFVPKVGIPVEEGANAFIAEYDKSAEKTMLMGHISQDGTFDVKAFTIWLDNSGRRDYWTDAKFVR